MMNKNLMSSLGVVLSLLCTSAGFAGAPTTLQSAPSAANPSPLPATAAKKGKGKSPEHAAHIVAKVGNSVISSKDVMERIKLTILTSGLKDSPSLKVELYPQVLKGLMDEKTQLFETAKYKFEVPAAELEAAFDNLAKDNGMTKEGLLQLLKKNKIDPETLRDRLKAQIAWVRYVRARFESQAHVSDDDVRKKEESIKKLKDVKQYEIYEIFIRAQNPQDMQNARKRADFIHSQLKAGAPFRALAHEASDSITKNSGGYLGWMTHGQWNIVLQEIAEKLQPGQFSAPIQAASGVYIIYLSNIKHAGESAPSHKVVTFAEARLPINPNSSPEQIERYVPVVEALKAARGLSAFQAAANAAGISVTKSDKKPVESVNAYIQSNINAEKGKTIDPPVMTPEGLYMAMIGSIESVQAELPSFADIKASLEQEKLMKLSIREMARLDAGVFKEILITDPKEVF